MLDVTLERHFIPGVRASPHCILDVAPRRHFMLDVTAICHFMRYVIRPLLRSYGVISTFTLSPVRMRM